MSLSPKTVRWLTANGPASLQGKTVVITGANSGVGFKTAEVAAFLGAGVILACRNADKAEAARRTLLADYPAADVRIMTLDLADLGSIARFAAALEEVDVDAFVHNAGVFHLPGQKTADGFDRVMGTNYLGVYALTEATLPHMLALPHEVRLIHTISLVHRFAKPVDDPLATEGQSDMALYASSKLCLARYSYALAARCAGTNVRVQMTHPGIAITPLGLNAVGVRTAKLAPVAGRLFQSAEKGSLSVPYLLAHDRPDGAIVGPTKLFGGWGYPKDNAVCRKVKQDATVLLAATEKAIKNGTS